MLFAQIGGIHKFVEGAPTQKKLAPFAQVHGWCGGMDACIELRLQGGYPNSQLAHELRLVQGALPTSLHRYVVTLLNQSRTCAGLPKPFFMQMQLTQGYPCVGMGKVVLRVFLLQTCIFLPFFSWIYISSLFSSIPLEIPFYLGFKLRLPLRTYKITIKTIKYK